MATPVAGVLAAMSPAIENGGEVDKRGWFIGVTNLTDTELRWSPWITCAKGVKDKRGSRPARGRSPARGR